MNNKMLVLMVMILLVPTSLALEVDYVSQQARAFNVTIPCDLNGYYCASNVVCNVTLVSPNTGEYIVNNRRYPIQGNYILVNLTGSETRVLGYNQGNVICNDPTTGLNSSADFTLLVTPSGNASGIGIYIILIGAAWFLGFFGFFGKNVWVSILGGMAMIILGLYTMNNGIDIYRNFGTQAFSIMSIGIGALFSLTAGEELISENM